jgi:1-acyl-sn-glycerol-3-phosphate acyltransferase
MIYFIYIYGHRWTLCAEEYCAKNPYMAAWFGTGKILPISRGAGKNQELLTNFGEKLNVGDWVHIFPEGRIWQDNSSPSRDFMGCLFSPSGRLAPPLTKLGPLKWGTAKIIADAEECPVIIPIYHFGMEEILPQNKLNKVISWIPRTGCHIFIKVGDPIKVDDLIQTYKEKMAMAEKIARENGTYNTQEWTKYKLSEENQLHVKLTSKLQLALLKLEAELLALRQQQEENFTHQSYFVKAKNRLSYLHDAAQSKAREKADRAKAKANLIHQHISFAKSIAKDRYGFILSPAFLLLFHLHTLVQ